MIKNHNNNITNDVPVAGTDFFADSESFLNELTDSELAQINGGGADSTYSLGTCYNHNGDVSGVSLLLCHDY